MDYSKVKADSFKTASLPEEIRNRALQNIAEALNQNKESIFKANSQDCTRGQDAGLPGPILGRLKFDEHKLGDCTKGISDLISLSDPLFKSILKRQLDDGLILEKVTCPIGVIGIIFESRPDALVQISALCIKSGNCVVLKGGSEAALTNRALFDVIYKAGKDSGLPENFLTLVESHEGIAELLKCHDSIDLIIPRGSNGFVQYIMDNSKIPVMGHADGICHIYVDKDADIEKAVPIIIDSKTQYVSACNAVETLLVHKDAAQGLKEKIEKSTQIPIEIIDATCDEDFKEYLDYKLTFKTVSNIDEAINHINRFGSHHTDCIITENDELGQRFMDMVDSAGVYRNCSTRFADGFRYGFGAEVGISTGKLHARGPVGLDGLVTYKYRLNGNGQIVADYASGKSSFKFIDL